MITEDYVSFETAKLLKENGFDGECGCYYFFYNEAQFEESLTHWNWNDGYTYRYSAPTLQMAMKWLREVHNQHIVVEAYNYMARLRTDYYVEIQNLNEPTAKNFCVNGCMRKRTYEEAYEAAIKYCLENLI